MANLYGTLEGSRGTTSRTGTDLLRARLATWHAAVVVTLDDFGAWTVHTELADPQEAAGIVPAIVAAGNLHTGRSTYEPGVLSAYKAFDAAYPRIPSQSPQRRPTAVWSPYREEFAAWTP